MAISYRAIQRNARISPRKVRLSADLIRGKGVADALTALEFDNRRGSYMLRKVLQSAVANAQSRGGHDPLDLRVVESSVDEGFTIKRYRVCGRGRMHGIKKRCSHISVVVATGEE
ncbi:MAG: 50S ribosomal protein L22 [Planctomycetota bacterium]|jgi:large subunit ribosomal protein L22